MKQKRWNRIEYYNAQQKTQRFLVKKRIHKQLRRRRGISKDNVRKWNKNSGRNNLSKSTLTLRGVLYCTLARAGGAKLVDHSSDVLHPSVHHSLHVVHVEQVEALQTTLHSCDLAPGVAQAG